jgi:hypothetical protein
MLSVCECLGLLQSLECRADPTACSLLAPHVNCVVVSSRTVVSHPSKVCTFILVHSRRQAAKNPNTVVKISRDASFSHKHPSIIGPENSFLYLGPNNTGVGYANYGTNATQFLMTHFRQPGKKEGSMYVILL